jgi:hypothetical protein
MSTPESKVKQKVRALLDKYNIYYFMPVKHQLYGKAGIGDFICCVNSRFLAIETKGPDGEETELQEEDTKSVKRSNGIKVVIKMEDLHKLEVIIHQLLLES